ncbi:MAG TPA: hypothetical protein VFN44_02935 [Solirubrobacteraceae bacterium]|nr:hypothetical protein [Solirubrobacteraceae bacterium]
MHPHRITRSAALGLTLAALAASTASAVPADLRSPDARDAARTAEAVTGGPRQDLRSPDARDLAAGRGTFSAPEVTVVKVSEPSPVAGGLDWADAGIGAGGMLGLVLVGAGGALLITRRTHDRTAHRRTAISG